MLTKLTCATTAIASVNIAMMWLLGVQPITGWDSTAVLGWLSAAIGWSNAVSNGGHARIV